MHRRRSRGVFSVRLAPPVGKQFAEEVNPVEIGSDERFKLFSADKHHPPRGIDEHNRGALCESRFGSEVGGYHEATSIAHRYRVSPIHDMTVPLRTDMWDNHFGFGKFLLSGRVAGLRRRARGGRSRRPKTT